MTTIEAPTLEDADVATLARELANAYDLPVSLLLDALLLAYSSMRIARPEPVKERIRALERRIKADPGDREARAELFRLRAGQQRVAFTGDGQPLVVERSNRNRRNRVPNEAGLNVAVRVLRGFWIQHKGDHGLLYEHGDFILFLGEALDGLGWHPTKTDADALRYRLMRLK